MTEPASYIYAMTSEFYQSSGLDRKYGLYKVGKTNDLEKRRKELSRPPGVAEEFRICYKAQCSNEADAKAVEKAVHSKAKQLKIHNRKNREFIRSRTFVAIQLLIRQSARELGITITEGFDGTAMEAIALFENAPCLPQQIIETIPKQERAMYFQGAIDSLKLLGAMLGYSGGTDSIEWNLRKISDDLILNRDLDDEFPPLQSTLVDQFRNCSNNELRDKAKKFVLHLNLIEREETFSYRYNDDQYEFTGEDGILDFKTKTH